MFEGIGLESIAKSALETKILDLCETHLAPQGFHAVDVDANVGPTSIVRIFVERVVQNTPDLGTPISPGTSLEHCAQASRLIGDVLDAQEVMPAGYSLEVSSPGLDRRLRVLGDFEGVVGKEVKMKLTESIEGKGANLTGTLQSVDGNVVVLKVSGQERRVPLEKIKRANVVWHF